MTLTWYASTDNVRVAKYDIYRNGTYINTTTTTTYADTGLSPTTTYTYYVVAKDEAGNSAQSSSKSGTTLAADSQAPSAPAYLTIVNRGTSSITISWMASYDNIGVVGYSIYRNGVLSNANTVATSDTQYGLVPNTTYTFYVVAKDAVGNTAQSSTITATTLADTQPPTAPLGLAAANRGVTSITIGWAPSSDNSGIARYNIYANNSFVASTNGLSYTITSLKPGTTYLFDVVATDLAGNTAKSSMYAQTLQDTEAPIPATYLMVTSRTATKLTISWTAGSDNAGAPQYDVYRNGVLIKSVGTATSYTDTGLAPNTSYTYYVYTYDTLYRVPSSSITGTTLVDTEAPTAPANLSVSSRTEKSITLSWGTSTDNVGIKQYDIYRNGTLVGSTTTATTFTNTGLLPNTTYTYAVIAKDTSGNTAQSSSITGTTLADTQAPTTPANLSATATTETSIAIRWDAATDNIAVTQYNIFRNGTYIGSTATSTAYTDTGLAEGTSYTYTILAKDAAGNVSDLSSPLSVKTLGSAPTAPTNLRVISATATSISLYWNASTDDVGVTQYNIYRDGIYIGATGTATSFVDNKELTEGKSYKYTVKAKDAAGNLSDASNEIIGTTQNEVPTAPSGLRILSTTTTSIGLYWEAATDNVGVTQYNVYRDGVYVGSTGTATSFTDSNGLVSNTKYTYTVKAKDAVENLSQASNEAVGIIDAIAPSAPTNLRVLSTTATSISLYWNASTDEVGVIQYNVYRDGVYVGATGTSTSFTDNKELAEGKSYKYTVKAIDKANNLSAASNEVIGTTQSQAPTAPNGLRVMSTTTTSIALYWEASTDNVGVTQYNVYRNGIYLGSTGTATSFTDDKELVPNTRYTYTVKAKDAAENLSQASNEVVGIIDTMPPTVPTGLTILSVGGTTIEFGWNKSEDNVGVVQYNIFRDGVYIGSTGTALSFTDEGLEEGKSYNYTVLAKDGATKPNVSAQSNVLIGTTQNQPPTAPSDLRVTSAQGTSIELGWNKSEDNVGVTQYNIFRDGIYVGSTGTATSFTDDKDLVPNRRYTYTVIAKDKAGNVSQASNEAVGIIDTIAPTVPTDLVVLSSTGTTIEISWSKSEDNVGVAQYNIFRDGVYKGSTGTALSFTDEGLEEGKSYNYTVLAKDGATKPNVSAQSNVLIGTTQNQPPTAPSDLRVTSAQGTSIELGWIKSEDNVGVTQYNIFRDGIYVGSTGTATSFTDNKDLVPNRRYTYTVIAKDKAGNISQESNEAAGIIDTIAPTAPSNLQVSSTDAYSVSLYWEPSTDNVAVTQYNIFCDGEYVGSTGTATSFTDDNGVAPNTSYTYTVLAKDKAGNASVMSNSIVATTQGPISPPPSGTKFILNYDGKTYHYDMDPKNSKIILNALLSNNSIYLANRQNPTDEPMYVLENYYGQVGPAWIQILASWLKDVTVKYENGEYTKQDYLTISNTIRDLLKCTLAGRASLMNDHLVYDPNDYAWSTYFRDLNMRIVLSDESYANGNTSNEVQWLVAAINGYVNAPLYEFERMMSLSLVANSFISAIQSVASLIGTSSTSTQAVQRDALARQMQRVESAVLQAEKDAIISETPLLIRVISKFLNDLKAKNAVTKTADEVNEWWRTVKGYTNPPYTPGTNVLEFELEEITTFVRVYDNVNSFQKGGWIMKKEDIVGLTAEQIKDKYALPTLPKYITDVEIPAETKLRIGEANPLPGWGSGGGTQIDMMGQFNFGEKFLNPREL
ncbi:MAG: fibronectin type III domain-containing protein [Clostridia bacterium]|nr:fibronectin type III domain-containing protein [Clostridia bacterium]